MYKIIFFLGLLLIFQNSFSQNLTYFTGLESTGDIPKEFLISSTEKYKTDLNDNENKSLGKDFFLSTRFFIDNLLLSGNILFNEPVSDYLIKVAEYVLKSEPELYNELQFYVIKSNTVNAFSTDQGIIFFTTALLAQLENEAQLAYILSHEISHYTEKHAQDGYAERKEMRRGKSNYKNLSYNARLGQMSTYRKSVELEADAKGIDLYLKSKYAVDEIINSFGVLMFSHLPFQDISFDTTFLNTNHLVIPATYFPDTIKSINDNENYDDSKSTHPNIRKRIDKSVDIIGDRTSKGDLKYVISETDFKHIRNLCRFESVKIKLAEREYGKAIYDLFLLKKEFNENEFLELSLVKALYGISKYKTEKRYSEIKLKLKKVEGESYKLHALLKKLSPSQANVIALRYAFDLHQKKPKNKLYSKYYNNLLTDLALNPKIDIDKFSGISFNTYKDSIGRLSIEFNVKDSIKAVEDSNLSKYKKIKLKKNLNLLLGDDVASTYSLDDFHYYALQDLVKNHNLNDQLKKIQEIDTDKGDDEEYIFYEDNESIHLGIDSIVIIDPYYNSYLINGKKDLKKSEEFKEKLSKLYISDYKKLDLNRQLIDSKSFLKSEVEKYNQLGTINSWFEEILLHENQNFITSNHDQIQLIKNDVNCSNFLFSQIELEKERKMINSNHIIGIVLLFTIPIVIYDLVKVRYTLNYSSILLDANTDQIIYEDYLNLPYNGSKVNIDLMVFHILNNINSKEKIKK